jgi:FkbM family methyltransferase
MLNSLRFIVGHPLNRDAKLAAVRRWLSWQIRSRVAGRPVLEPFVNSTGILVEPGMTGATGNLYCGLHEVSEMAFVLHVLRQSDLFLDVGANIGSYTLLASGGTRCDVVAVEPVPETYQKLRRNIGVNDLFGTVTAVNAGAGAEPGVLRFSSEADTVNHVMSEGESGPSVEVQVLPLDSILNGRVPTVIKIDVEGWELHALQGLKRTLGDARLKAVVMEVNGSGQRYGITDEQICSFLTELGFEQRSYLGIERRLTGHDGSDNVIFCRDASFLEGRIQSAPKTQLVNGQI